MILRGKKGEIRSESWSHLEHRAYTTTDVIPFRDDDPEMRGMDSHYTLVLLVPGREPIRTTATFYRGCNCLAVPSDAAEFIPPEFADPIEAMEYAIRNGLETPPVLSFKESAR